jgi:hypothetical protein
LMRAVGMRSVPPWTQVTGASCPEWRVEEESVASEESEKQAQFARLAEGRDILGRDAHERRKLWDGVRWRN